MAICAILVERPLPAGRGVNPQAFAYYDKVAVATEAKTIGAMIRKRRVQEGLTQVKLAELLGASPFSINEWEHGKYRPVRFWKEVSDWLGIPVKKLFKAQWNHL
jgi:DNA-binding XRE family transcriptional regulator